MNNKMEKRYGLFTAMAMVIGIVIGSGIFFKTEAVIAKSGGSASTGVLALIIMGLIMVVCAYAFSILARKIDKVNGLVDYAEALCGEKYAYYIGWFMTFIYTPAITGCLAWVSAMYFGKLMGWGLQSGEVVMVAGMFLVADAFVNALAPKLAGKLQVGTTVIKLIPLSLMAIVGIVKGLAGGTIAENFSVTADIAGGSGGLTAAVVSLAFAYEGWILASSINSEMKNPKKDLPLALVCGGIAIALIYVLYYLGVCGVISVDELMQKGSTAAFVGTFGNVWGVLLSVFIVISCMGTTNGLIMATHRNMYSLAVRGNGPMPSVFARVDETADMPINSSLFGTLIAFVWMFIYWGGNIAGASHGPWFGLFAFDSSELPIITLYAMYIPIFLKMMKDKELKTFDRVVIPSLAIIACVFLCGCAVYAHGIVKYREAAAQGSFSFPVLFYIIIFAVVMLCGTKFYNKKK